MDFVGKVMSLLFNMLSRLVIAFLPRSKCLLISWLQSPSTVILEPKKIMSLFLLFPHLFAMKWWDQMPWSSFCECWVLRYLFHTPVSPSSRGSSVPLHLAIRVISSAYMRLLVFLPELVISICDSSSLAFLMMYSAYMLNKRGDNIQLDVLLPQFGTSQLFHVQV